MAVRSSIKKNPWPCISGRFWRAPGGVGAADRGGFVGVRLCKAKISRSVHRSGRVPKLDQQEDWNLIKVPTKVTHVKPWLIASYRICLNAMTFWNAKSRIKRHSFVKNVMDVFLTKCSVQLSTYFLKFLKHFTGTEFLCQIFGRRKTVFFPGEQTHRDVGNAVPKLVTTTSTSFPIYLPLYIPEIPKSSLNKPQINTKLPKSEPQIVILFSHLLCISAMLSVMNETPALCNAILVLFVMSSAVNALRWRTGNK